MSKRVQIKVLTFQLIGPCGHELSDSSDPDSDSLEDDSIFTAERIPKNFVQCEICGKEYVVPKAVEKMFG